MNIFCDTNIILEFIQQRKQSQQVERVLEYAEANGHGLYLSFGSFYTITYLVEKYLKQEDLTKEERTAKLRNILNGILDLFQFGVPSPKALSDGVNDILFTDLEDSYQAHVAVETGCSAILTIDAHHYKQFGETGLVEVLTPQEFLDKFTN